MSEQLHDISVSEMDLTMQEFVKLIRATKSQFGTKDTRSGSRTIKNSERTN